MATKTFPGTRETLANASQATNNNEVLEIVEVLNEMNDLINVLPIMQATDMTSHKSSRRTVLPTSTWIKIGNGWDATVAQQQMIEENIGILKDRMILPEDVADIQPEVERYRSMQERSHLEGMAQELANTMIYGDSSGAPEEIDGLATRYSGTSLNGTLNKAVFQNTSTDGGSSDYTSAYIMQPGMDRIHLVYPRFSNTYGLTKRDEGRQFIEGDNWDATTNKGKKLWAYITEFEAKLGIAIPDIRSCKRIANINVDYDNAGKLNWKVIAQAQNNFKTPGPLYFVCNETVENQIQFLMNDKANVNYTAADPFAGKPAMVNGMPIVRMDAILNTEDFVS